MPVRLDLTKRKQKQFDNIDDKKAVTVCLFVCLLFLPLYLETLRVNRIRDSGYHPKLNLAPDEWLIFFRWTGITQPGFLFYYSSQS